MQLTTEAYVVDKRSSTNRIEMYPYEFAIGRGYTFKSFRKNSKNPLIAQRTVFVWIVIGKIP